MGHLSSFHVTLWSMTLCKLWSLNLLKQNNPKHLIYVLKLLLQFLQSLYHFINVLSFSSQFLVQTRFKHAVLLTERVYRGSWTLFLTFCVRKLLKLVNVTSSLTFSLVCETILGQKYSTWQPNILFHIFDTLRI